MSSVATNSTAVVADPPKPSLLVALLKRPAVLSLLLVIATAILYYPAHSYAFVKYDDNDYIYENPPVQSGVSWSTIKWAFTTAHAANWHPLTWLSHALDCQLFGLNPSGPHVVNIGLHALNAVLLFWVLRRATGFPGRSFMVAALFALHPINVESVAWVAERKNMLSMMFFLLALGAYRWYASRPQIGRYATVALLFGLGLMAKPQVITLPCVLLLWDYWPLQRMFPPQENRAEPTVPGKSLAWLMLEKVPLLVMALASAVITLRVQHAARVHYARLLRADNALVSYGLYLKKAFWPAGLALFYPHADHLSAWRVLLTGLILLLITILVMAGHRHRYLPVGWFWFVGTLVPMIGLIQVGAQAMADRYAYTSFLGLFFIVCWGAADISEHLRLPAVLLASVSVAVLLTLMLTARRQLSYWQTDEDLWSHALQVTTRNWVAESQLGSALAMDARVPEAMPHFYKAIAIEPNDASANMGIAIYLLQSGNFSDAIVYYRRVVQNTGEKHNLLVNAWVGMAKAYRALGDKAAMRECLQAAKRVGSESGGTN